MLRAVIIILSEFSDLEHGNVVEMLTVRWVGPAWSHHPPGSTLQSVTTVEPFEERHYFFPEKWLFLLT